MRKENDALKLAQITSAVDSAIAAKKIPADKKEHFINVGKKLGIGELETTLEAMVPAVKISQTLAHAAAADAPSKSPWETRMDEIRSRLNK